MLHDQPLFELPARSFYKIYGTEQLRSNEWYALARIPGAFLPTADRISPADELWVTRKYLRDHQYPKLICIPKAEAAQLKRVAEANRLDIDMSQVGDSSPQPIWQPVQPTTMATPVDGEASKPNRLSDYQAEAVIDFIGRHRLLVSLPIGSGKSIVAISGAETLFAHDQIDRCVIIGSRTVVGGDRTSAEDGEDVWRPMLWEFYERNAARFDGPAKERTAQIREILNGEDSSKYVLTTFDQWRMQDQDDLMRLLGPRTMVVIDEAHHLKNPKTQRFRAIRRALASAPGGPVDYRVLITGSVAHDKVLDVFGPVDLLGLNVWNDVTEFRETYFNWTRKELPGHRAYYDFTGFKSDGPQMLNAVLDGVAFRRSREQIDLQLPPRRRDIRRVIVGLEERQIYEQITKILNEELETAIHQGGYDSVFRILNAQRLFASDPVVLLMSGSDTSKKVRQMVGAGRIKAASPGGKFRALCHWIEEFLEGDDGKAVIFTPFEMTQQFAQTLLSNSDACEEARLDPEIYGKSVWFSGGTKHHHAIRTFRQDPNVRLLWSTDAGSEGLNYQDVTSYCVHYDDVWSEGTMDQREGRVYRRNQKRPVLFQQFYTDVEELRDDMNARKANSTYIDHRIRRLLLWKQALKGLLDGQAAD